MVSKTYLFSILTAYFSFCDSNNFNVLTNVWYMVLQAFSIPAVEVALMITWKTLVLNILGTSIQYTYDLFHGYMECSFIDKLLKIKCSFQILCSKVVEPDNANVLMFEYNSV